MIRNGTIVRWKHKLTTLPIHDINSNVVYKVENGDTLQLVELELDFDTESIMVLYKNGIGYIDRAWIYCGEGLRRARYEFVV